MEGEGSDSKSNYGLGNDTGLGLQKDSGYLQPRVKTMDGEEKLHGTKRKLKPIEVSIGSDDDEPIGALFKLKKSQNPKRAKSGLEESGDKGQKVLEVRVENSRGEYDDLGGMDDTLAIFRKKLKGPKKENGSVVVVGRSSSLSSTGLSDVLANGLIKDGGLGAKSMLVAMEKDQVGVGDGPDAILKKGLEIKTKGKSKKSKRASPLDSLLQTGEEKTLFPEKVLNNSSDENLEVSLSVFVQKAQSGLNKKSKSSIGLKQKTVAQTVEDGMTPGSEIFSEDFHSIARRRSQFGSSSDSRLVLENSTSEDSLHLVSGRTSTSLVADCSDVVENQRSDDGLSESNCIQKNLLFDNQGQSSIPACTDKVTHQEIPEESVSVSALRSLSSLVACSNKSMNFEDGALSVQGNGLPKVDPCVPDQLSDGDDEKFTGVQAPDASVQLHSSYHAFDSTKTLKPSCNRDVDVQNKIPKTYLEEPNIASVRLAKEDDTKSGGINHENTAVYEEASGASSPSITPDQIEAYPEDAGSLLNSENKDRKPSMRNAKKCRHVDMAYEGDADWEILIHEQSFLESQQALGSDRSVRSREKSEPSIDMVMEGDSGGAAAVSVGLKAREAGPVEKIKFKEVFKRKGGLQEYLECRNLILDLWSKDVSRILPLVDCGVTNTPSEDQSLRASLIREIYSFLDQSGYINVGIALEKEKADADSKHHYKLVKDNNLQENCGSSIADTEDGVSFIVGRVKSSECSLEGKAVAKFDDKNQTSESAEGRGLATQGTVELSTMIECVEQSADVHQEKCGTGGKLSSRMVHLDVLNVDPPRKMLNCRAVPVTTPELMTDSFGIQSTLVDHADENYHMQCDSGTRKRVIVVGAGPAGLTAARHLQRQGYSVAVLEARSRIGGRVYTDRSSLSVPVDVGASIITGVEADVATERRPDPSSLICAQLGLELTVLNSDCPLYDIVTGQKVPADLDEALEAEYNSLLDDMNVLVAEKGDHAMIMSLEDGLEYALKRRRMARLATDHRGIRLQKSDDACFGFAKLSVDGEFAGRGCSNEEILSPLERRIMNWHYAHLEYGCAALLKEVSLPYWNQDDAYGGFGGAHCMIKGGYSNVVESLGEGLCIHLNHVVTDVVYSTKDSGVTDEWSSRVKVSTSNGIEFSGDAVLITVPLGCLKAESMKFTPPLPEWKNSSIQRLGFGVLNKVVLEFPYVFWDDSVDYFGATAEETNQRGQCFMFWNVRKTVGAPVLIALVVGKAAIYGQSLSSSDHVTHAVMILRKLFGQASVPDPVASVVTDWGRDPFSYGAYSYVAIGSSGEDYDILGRPVENCLFFAGEATCKEHPDTVGGAMMSGLREAVRIINILSTGNDYTAEVKAMEAAERHTDSERIEVRDIKKRLEAVELSNVLYKNSFDGTRILTKEALLQDMFSNAKTTAGRLHLAKELLTLPAKVLKSFAGTKKGLTTLNLWILDSLGKDGTQLLRHCVRILLLVSTDLLAVRMSGIGKTVKEKVCVHTSRDIRAIASQLVTVWLEIFRKEKGSHGGLKLLRQTTAMESSKSRSLKGQASGKPPLRTHHGAPINKGGLQVSARGHLHSSTNIKKVNSKPIKLESTTDSKSDINSSKSEGSTGRLDGKGEEDNIALSEEEQAAFAVAEAARAAALAAAEAYASSEAKCNTLLQLPKIPSFHKFARREQYAQMDESDIRRKWSGSYMGRQDCLSEIDSRNCRVRNWSVDFSAACANLESSRISGDNLSQRSHSNEIACHLNLREHSGESVAVDSSLFTKAWVDTVGSEGVKDYHAIERWQSQAAAAGSDFFDPTMHVIDEEDSNTTSKLLSRAHDRVMNESSASQVTINKPVVDGQPRGAERIKQAVVDYVASLLMPLYKARKIDKEGYKSIMKKTATKVMEQATDAEKAMTVPVFLDFKRKNKIRAFVDKLIERHMAMKPDGKV